MGRERSVGIQTHVARRKQQARFADVMHGLHLLGTDFLFYPQKLALAGKVADQPLFVQIGKDFHQLFRCPHRINHVVRLCVQRPGFKVGGKQIAIAVHDIRTRG